MKMGKWLLALAMLVMLASVVAVRGEVVDHYGKTYFYFRSSSDLNDWNVEYGTFGYGGMVYTVNGSRCINCKATLRFTLTPDNYYGQKFTLIASVYKNSGGSVTVGGVYYGSYDARVVITWDNNRVTYYCPTGSEWTSVMSGLYRVDIIFTGRYLLLYLFAASPARTYFSTICAGMNDSASLTPYIMASSDVDFNIRIAYSNIGTLMTTVTNTVINTVTDTMTVTDTVTNTIFNTVTATDTVTNTVTNLETMFVVYPVQRTVTSVIERGYSLTELVSVAVATLLVGISICMVIKRRM